MEPQHHAIAARILEGLFALAVEAGVDADALRVAMGLDPRGLAAFGDWAPIRVAVAFWREAVRLSGDPMLGIALGERLPLGLMGLMSHSSNASSTLREAYGRPLRSHRLAATSLRPSLTDDGDVTRLSLAFASGL